jgi:CheY-like chemotaxis protein
MSGGGSSSSDFPSRVPIYRYPFCNQKGFFPLLNGVSYKYTGSVSPKSLAPSVKWWFVMEPRSLCILLVEDDEIDAEFFLRCLQMQDSTLEVTVVRDAGKALRMLCGGPGQPPLEGPYVILLDLGLPGMNGFEFLQELRSDPRLKASIVFVLSGSTSERDCERVYAYGVAGFLRKTVFTDHCASLIHLLEFYRDLVEIPILP